MDSADSGWGAVVIVGESDIDGIRMYPVSLLPAEFAESAAADAAGDLAPGTLFPPPYLRGYLLDEAGDRIQVNSSVILTGHDGARRLFPVDRSGRFEIPRLLPGSYQLQANVNGYRSRSETIIVGYRDMEIEFRLSRD